jgi:phosphoglycolate phosphatase
MARAKSLNGVEHVCFDKDGTLTDVHAYWVHTSRIRASKVIARWKLPDSLTPRVLVAMGVDPEKDRLLPNGPVGYYPRHVVIAAVVKALGAYTTAVTPEGLSNLFAEIDNAQQESGDYALELLPGVRAVLDRLRALGIRLSIYSSDRRENTTQVIERLGLGGTFAAVVGGGCVSRPKPDPEGFLLACARTGTSPGESVYVGDTLDDIAMATTAGAAAAIGVATGLEPYERLADKTDWVVRSLDELGS